MIHIKIYPSPRARRTCCQFLPVLFITTYHMLLNSKLARRDPVTSWPGFRSSRNTRVRDRTLEPCSQPVFMCPNPRTTNLIKCECKFTRLCRPLTQCRSFTLFFPCSLDLPRSFFQSFDANLDCSVNLYTARFH